MTRQAAHAQTVSLWQCLKRTECALMVIWMHDLPSCTSCALRRECGIWACAARTSRCEAPVTKGIGAPEATGTAAESLSNSMCDCGWQRHLQPFFRVSCFAEQGTATNEAHCPQQRHRIGATGVLCWCKERLVVAGQLRQTFHIETRRDAVGLHMRQHVSAKAPCKLCTLTAGA